MKNEVEQIALQNDMSIEFVTWFFNEKKVGCGNVWFMMMAAMWEGWKGRSIEMDKLATENVALKNVFSQKEIPSEAVDAFMETAVMDHDWNETSEWSWVENETEVIHAVLDALKPETPATDRIVAEAEACGVEKAIAHLEKKFSNIGVQIMNLQWLADSLCEGGRQMSNRIPNFGWNRLKLAKLTYAQLAQLEEQVKAEHACKNGIHLFDKAGQRKLDALSWAVYNKQKAERAA